MSTTPGDYQISDRVRRELYAMIREFWKRNRGGEGPGFIRRYPPGQAASYGGIRGTGTQALTGSWATIGFGATLMPCTDDVTSGANGTLTFATPGVYLIRGEITAVGTLNSVIEFGIQLVSDHSGATVISEAMYSHTGLGGSGTDRQAYVGVTCLAEFEADESVEIQATGADVNATRMSLTASRVGAAPV